MTRHAKVVVIGPGEAGKSTLIRLLHESAVNVAVRGRTVAMDIGHLRRPGHSVSLIGVPGQRRFAPVRAALVQGAAAAVWVIPGGAAPDPETAELLAAVPLRNAPYAVVVNFRGAPDPAQAVLPPSGLRPPRLVVQIDLHAAGAERGIEDAIWRLLGVDAVPTPFFPEI